MKFDHRVVSTVCATHSLAQLHGGMCISVVQFLKVPRGALIRVQGVRANLEVLLMLTGERQALAAAAKKPLLLEVPKH